MERALSAESDIGETTINYAAKTVYLPPSTQNKAQKIIEKIEPGVMLVPADKPNSNMGKVKYRIEGEFCPGCAAKMKRVLSARADIGETTINYATKTIFLPPGKVNEAEKIMNEIESGIKLVPILIKKVKENDEPEKKYLIFSFFSR